MSECGGGGGDIGGNLEHKLSFLIYLIERIINSCRGILPAGNKTDCSFVTTFASDRN